MQTSCYQKSIFLDKIVADSDCCLFCHEVARDPVKDQCGHTFGRECLRARAAEQPTCPVSQSPLPPEGEWFSEEPQTATLRKSLVRCPSGPDCPWTGQLEALEGHLRTDCGRQGTEKGLASPAQSDNKQLDLRVVQCIRCLEEFRAFELREHNKSCPWKTVSCPNSCGKKLMNKDIQLHFKNGCPNAIKEKEVLRPDVAFEQLELLKEQTLVPLGGAIPQTKQENESEAAPAKTQTYKQIAENADSKEKGSNQSIANNEQEIVQNPKNNEKEILIKEEQDKQKEMNSIAEQKNEPLQSQKEGMELPKAEIEVLQEKNAQEQNEPVLVLQEISNQNKNNGDNKLIEKEEERMLSSNDLAIPITTSLEVLKNQISINMSNYRFSENLKHPELKLESFDRFDQEPPLQAFALIEEAIISKKIYTFEMNKTCSSGGVGVCSKKKIQANNFRSQWNGTGYWFVSNGDHYVHGTHRLILPKNLSDLWDSYKPIVELIFDADTRRLEILNKSSGASSFMIINQDEDIDDLHPCVYTGCCRIGARLI